MYSDKVNTLLFLLMFRAFLENFSVFGICKLIIFMGNILVFLFKKTEYALLSFNYPTNGLRLCDKYNSFVRRLERILRTNE